MITVANAKEFEELLLQQEKPCLVDFWGPSCAPCVELNRTLEALEPQFVGKIMFLKVNADEIFDVSVKCEVRGLPTLIMFDKGEIVERWVGAMSQANLKTKLEKALDQLQ